MRAIETIAELRHQVRAARGRGERIAFVPTMGALHAGHQSLFRTAHAQCDFVIASVYVNPAQFGPGEDLDRYPRTPADDAAIAESAGVDLLWRPKDAELWPGGRTPGRGPGHGSPSSSHATMVQVGELARRLEGAARPGHFDGVATIVAKLLGAVQPDVLYLGEKDYQQLVVLRHVLLDLLSSVEVRAVPTVRDPDGLALSSRNAYLSPEQRAAALAIPHTLEAVAEAVAAGERSAGRLRGRAEVQLAEAPGVDVEYVELVDPDTLDPVDAVDAPTRLLVAARVGSTRLIDNRLLLPNEGAPS